MAILHRQPWVTANGENETLESYSALLQELGPLIQVTISPSQSAVPMLVQRGYPIRPAFTGIALLDTGSSISCIDFSVVRILDLPTTDLLDWPALPSDIGPIRTELHTIHFSIVGMAFAQDVDVIAHPLGRYNIAMIIGRDVLQKCTLIYNGRSGDITLCS